MKLWKYKYYKGKYYEIIGLAVHTENQEKLVMYKPLLWIKDFKQSIF